MPEQGKSTLNQHEASTLNPAPGSIMAFALGISQPVPIMKLIGAPRYSLMFGGFRVWKGRRLIGF